MCSAFGSCMEELLLNLRTEAAGTPCGLALKSESRRRSKEDGVFSIGVVHGGTAVEPPLRRQQVLHVVLL